MTVTKSKSLATIAAANGIATDPAFRAVTPPIYLTSTFAFEGFDQEGAYAYTRQGNPTRDLLGDTLAKLEGGAGAVVTASGMAAIDLVLSELEVGATVVAPHDCYWGTQRLLRARAAKGHFSVRFVDQGDGAAVEAAFGHRADLVLIETPSNPLMRVVDVAALVDLAHRRSAKVAVDNTFLSPALQRPLTLGADFCVHSSTKYLNGHSDVVGGAVVCADPAAVGRLSEWATTAGICGAPFDSYLTLRGLRTLFARIGHQQRTAIALAEFLRGRNEVKAVHYPGLDDHPGRDIVRRQQDGGGAMLSFELAGGVEAVRRFVGGLGIITLAESLGGVESLIAHPQTMTHAGMGPEAWAAAGIAPGLLRLSVGLEDVGDLLSDLEQGVRCI